MKWILFVVMKCFRHNMHPIQTIQGSQNTQALQYFTTINSSGKDPLVLSQPSVMILEIVNFLDVTGKSPSLPKCMLGPNKITGDDGSKRLCLAYLLTYNLCPVLPVLQDRTG